MVRYEGGWCGFGECRRASRFVVVSLACAASLLLTCGSAFAAPVGSFTEFPASGTPGPIAAGPDGNLWFFELTGNKIARITPTGAITEFTIPSATASYGIAAGPDGNVWFGEFDANKIARITPTGAITEFPIPTANTQPNAIAVGPDGNLWFTEELGDRIGRITPAGAITEFAVPTASSDPGEIAAGPDGNMWFTEFGGNKIGRITPTGTITEFPVPTASSQPNWIAAGADGNLWFTEFGGNKIGRITPTGTVTEFPVPTASSQPYAVAAGADGNLWFTEASGKIGVLGASAPAAVQAGPFLSGAAQAGSTESCQDAQWATWAGFTASASLYSFDGYQWLLDGAPIAGQSGQSYTPTSADVGHQLVCQTTATYPLPFLVVSAPATSAAITVQSPPSPPLPPAPAPAPAPSPSPAPLPVLSALGVSPHTFTITGRLVKGHCLAVTHADSGQHHCTRPISLTIYYTVSLPAEVTFTIERAAPGRLVKGHCNAPTRTNRHDRSCIRMSARATLTHTGTTGASRFILPDWNAPGVVDT